MIKEVLKKFIPSFLLSWYHFLLAFLGAIFYLFPSKKLIVIGVTGTNGKSTVVELTREILNEAGHKTASLSSIIFKIGNKEEPNLLKQTMPGRFQIQKFLRKAANSGCKYAVLEVTSEGILQHRHRFIDFTVAVFTNLTPEHIEAHKGFENYKKAKGKLFEVTKGVHVINLDDKNKDYFLTFKAKEKIGFTITKEKKQGVPVVGAEGIQASQYGSKFLINDKEFNIQLIGEFNIQNSLTAVSIAASQGISLEVCKKALEKVKGISGRMEEVISSPFHVFVDYAFTPAALRKVYESLKKNYNSRLLCLLGACGGGRDKWKRPTLGQIAEEYCDEIVLTNEDPYDENPEEILEHIQRGIKQKQSKKILERRKAISHILKKANPNDIVVITGKGSEPWICVENGKKIPWDDRKIAKEEFTKLSL
ncbi:Mur ligase family protein [Patescibacteria group bacterium]